MKTRKEEIRHSKIRTKLNRYVSVGAIEFAGIMTLVSLLVLVVLRESIVANLGLTSGKITQHESSLTNYYLRETPTGRYGTKCTYILTFSNGEHLKILDFYLDKLNITEEEIKSLLNRSLTYRFVSLSDIYGAYPLVQIQDQFRVIIPEAAVRKIISDEATFSLRFGLSFFAVGFLPVLTSFITKRIRLYKANRKRRNISNIRDGSMCWL